MNICPYCRNARSLLLGHVYCSNEGTAMQKLDTGTLFIKTKRLEETADHESRLSIRLMLNGQQHYKVGRGDHLVTPDNYLVVNQGQHYRTAFSADCEQEMILVAFQPGFAEGLLHDLVRPEDKLLDDPYLHNPQPVCFFEKTYPKDPVIAQLFSTLRSLVDEPMCIKKEADLDGIYTALLLRLLETHRYARQEINKLGSVKMSTRSELYRRLYIARDFMDAHISRKIDIAEAANTACLSPHHFKRTFKELFGISPHQFHIKKRLETAALLLQKQLPVNEVCRSVGFEDASSFIRLFRRHYACTPGEFADRKN